MKTIKFNGDLPFEVMAFNDRYIIAKRELDPVQDNKRIRNEVSMHSYCTFEETYEDLKQYPIYTVLDKKEGKRGGVTSYNVDVNTVEGANEMLEELMSGEIELSRRSSIDCSTWLIEE